MTSALLAGRSQQQATWAVLAAYCVALIALPSGFGPSALGFVWSLSRMLLGALIVGLVVKRKLSLRSLRAIPRGVLVGWALFLGFTAVSVALNPSSDAISRYGSMVIEGFLLFWVVTVTVRSPSDVRNTALVIATATAVMTCATLILGFLGLSYDGLFTGSLSVSPDAPTDTRFGLVRQQGSFAAPLFFGLWLAAASALILPYVGEPRRPVRAVAILGWGLLVLAIAGASVSRMAITGSVALAAGYFLIRGPRWLGAAAIVGSFALATGFASLTGGVLPNGAAPSASANPSPVATPAAGQSLPPPGPPTPAPVDEQALAGSNALRLEALRAAGRALAQRPLFGWGLLAEKEVVTQIGGKTNFVDSSYLALLVDIGLAGFGAFLILLAGIWRAAWPALRSPVGLSIGLSLAAVHAMSALAAFLMLSQGYALMWVLAALLVSAAKPAESREGQPVLARLRSPTPAREPSAASHVGVRANRHDR